MYRFHGILHKIISGIRLQIPVIYLPYNTGECCIKLPEHHTSYIIQFMPGSFEYTLVSRGIHQLHLVAEFFHTDRCSVPFNHLFIIEIPASVTCCCIMIPPCIIKRKRCFGIPYKIRYYPWQNVIGRL